MTKKVKALAFILFLLITAASFPAGAATDRLKSADGAYEYVLNGSYASLSRYLGEENPSLNPDGSYTIPSQVDGHEVRTLGRYLYAYQDVPSETVIIPDTVTYIDDEVFSYMEYISDPKNAQNPEYEDEEEYNSKLRRITIPNNVVDIGSYAFHGAIRLEEVTLPDSIRHLSSYAFYGCGVKKVTLGKGLSRISSYAFASCPNLSEVIIPENIHTIGKGAFRGCYALKELNVNYNTTFEADCYGVDYSGKPEKNKRIVFNLSRSVKGLHFDYAYKNNVPVAVNLNCEKSMFIGRPGIEFQLRAGGKTVTGCKSSNKKSVSASKTGKIKYLNKGSANITAKGKDGKSYRLRLFTLENIKLKKKSVSVKKGKTVSIKLTGKVHSINNKYKSSKIAKFSSKKSADTLKIKGLKKGSTTLKVKVNGIKTFKIKVKVL